MDKSRWLISVWYKEQQHFLAEVDDYPSAMDVIIRLQHFVKDGVVFDLREAGGNGL